MTDYRIRYQTYEFDSIDIHLCSLRGHQEYSDPEGIAENLGIPPASWPYFGVVWPSSEVLAHFIFNYDVSSKRILEIGCGMALSSHLLKTLGFDVSVTDRHPEVRRFLLTNSKLNKNSSIHFERTDWADKSDSLGLFDLIIGSDLLYEDDHIELLSNFIESHAHQTCDVILVDPGRGRVRKLVLKMADFGFTASYEKLINPCAINFEFKGKIVKFTRTNP